MRCFVSAYPWDLLDEGVDAALDRVCGELGVAGLTLHVACPAMTRIRPRGVEPRIVRSRGGVFFKPSEDRYGATRCKPVVSTRARSTDPLTTIAEGCASRGIELRVAIHAATIGGMAQRYPDAACKNALGDTSRVSLCLHNPDVRTLLAELVADVSSRPHVTGVELRDVECAWFEAFDPGLDASVPLTDTDRALLSLCFCETCQQRATDADVDAASVRRFVSVSLNARLSGNKSDAADMVSLIEQSGPLDRFMQWRAAERSTLLAYLAERTNGPFIVRQAIHATPGRVDATTGFDTRWRTAFESDVSAFSIGQQPETDAVEYGVRFAQSSAGGGAALVSCVSCLASRGVEVVTLDDYGAWSEEAMTFVKQAARVGRREATAPH